MPIHRALDLARGHHQAGRLPQAEEIYRKILAAAGDHADALHLLGVVALQRGQHAQAAELIARAIAQDPQKADFHDHFGAALHAQERFAEAAASFRKAIALAPNYAEAHNNLGAALQAQGLVDEAIDCFRKAISLKPQYADAHGNLGNMLREAEQFDEAIAAYRRAVQVNPRFAAAYAGLGTALARQQRGADAVDCYRKSLAIDPKQVRVCVRLGVELQKRNELAEAIDCFRRALALDPSDVDANTNLGVALRDWGHNEEALDHCRRAVELAPDNVKARNNLGGLLREFGQIEEALVHFRRAAELDPTDGQVHHNLAQSRRYGDADRPEIERMEAILTQETTSPESQMHLHFALGKVYNDCREWDRAFEHYRHANRVADVQHDDRPIAEMAEALAETCTESLLLRGPSLGRESRKPIFIVGMPRSATTLVEQILSSHAAVVGANELSDVGAMSAALSKAMRSELPYPQCLAQLQRDTAVRFADQYLARLSELGGDAQRVTDKMPTNFWHLGLIAMLFPNARIIHCRRNAMDVCLSCYFQNFRRRLSFAYDLTSLGTYYRRYEQIMAHWREVLPVKMLEVDYEALVEHQEDVSRTMFDCCELDWDAGCLRFHENARVVRTASNWQVRQPLYSHSVARWKRYAKHLGPLRDALAGDD